ncbi:MAG: Asp-tRNA(Asn)/Glu-tRNA(Gln) amidotransferase subunit GatA [Bacteroidia bacterium]
MRSYAAFRQAWVQGLTTCTQEVESFLEQIRARNHALNALVEVYADEALAAARAWDEQKAQGKPLPPLAGCVVVLKDNICHANHFTTAASRILQGFVSPYNATVVERLARAGVIWMGRANCDEFAMGSSNETSYYGAAVNPWAADRVPGGSSGGSAVAVAAGFCHVALGSDTGGSIRQPSAFCGIYGLKPTYGHVSRYGLIAYASSFDQIGPMAHNLHDLALVHRHIAGPDPQDTTTAPMYPTPWQYQPRAWKIAIFPQTLGVLDAPIAQAFENLLSHLRHKGLTVEEVDFPYLEYLVPVYYVLTTAEASSNLARYDGVRYGYRAAHPENLEALYRRSRSEGFGKEVRRRILLGTFVLSAGYYDAYYARAQKVRRILRDYTEKLLAEYDMILLPATPTLPFRLGEKLSDPIQMYMADLFTVYANLTGHPALSFPLGKSEGLPVGAQVMGRAFEENTLLNFAQWLSEQDFSGLA